MPSPCSPPPSIAFVHARARAGVKKARFIACVELFADTGAKRRGPELAGSLSNPHCGACEYHEEASEHVRACPRPGWRHVRHARAHVHPLHAGGTTLEVLKDLNTTEPARCRYHS